MSINGGTFLYDYIGGIMCIYHSIDIDPLPATVGLTVGLDLFVLAPLDPTVCTMGIMLRMITISIINGRFSLIFGQVLGELSLLNFA